MLGEHGCEISRKRHVVAHEDPVSGREGQAHGVVIGVADADGKPAAIEGGLAPVEFDIGKRQCGYIDKTGKVIIPPRFDNAYAFHEGRAAVVIDGKWGYIDKSGELVIPAEYEFAAPFREGLAAVMASGKHGYVERTGKFAWEPTQ